MKNKTAMKIQLQSLPILKKKMTKYKNSKDTHGANYKWF